MWSPLPQYPRGIPAVPITVHTSSFHATISRNQNHSLAKELVWHGSA